MLETLKQIDLMSAYDPKRTFVHLSLDIITLNIPSL